MSGPETEESNGWNGIGLTRGAAVKKKNGNTSLLMYSGLKKVPYSSMGKVDFHAGHVTFKRYLRSG